MGGGCSSHPLEEEDPQLSPLHPLTSQGKFIRINFDVAGYIVGANIETCILQGPQRADGGGEPGQLRGEAPGISLLTGSRRWSHREPRFLRLRSCASVSPL